MGVVERVNEVFQLYEKSGESQYLGEEVTKTQHSIQCAMCAERDGASTQEVIAAFLHDVGHLVGMKEGLPEMVTDGMNIGTKDHDIVGAKYLHDRGFPKYVCDIVGGHVQAKRYLVFKKKDYYEKLSEASKQTLVHQGGPMSREEAEKFEKSEAFNTILKMRTWDEQAKDSKAVMEPLEKYRQMCTDLLSTNK